MKKLFLIIFLINCTYGMEQSNSAQPTAATQGIQTISRFVSFQDNQSPYAKRSTLVRLPYAERSKLIRANDHLRLISQAVPKLKAHKNLLFWYIDEITDLENINARLFQHPVLAQRWLDIRAKLRSTKQQLAFTPQSRHREQVLSGLVHYLSSASSDVDALISQIDPSIVSYQDFKQCAQIVDQPEFQSIVSSPFDSDIRKQLLKRVIDHGEHVELANRLLTLDKTLANAPLLKIDNDSVEIGLVILTDSDFLDISTKRPEQKKNYATIFTPLHYTCLQAASHEHIQLIHTLAHNGADLNKPTELGFTPIMLTQELEMVRALLLRGASCMLPVNGNTLLHFYASKLQENQPNFDPSVEVNIKDLINLLPSKLENIKNNKGQTPHNSKFKSDIKYQGQAKHPSSSNKSTSNNNNDNCSTS